MYHHLSIEDWRFCRVLHLRHARARKRLRAYLRRRYRQGRVMERYERESDAREATQCARA